MNETRQTVTVSAGGQDWQVAAHLDDDYEVLTYLGDMQEGSIAAMQKLLRTVVGDQYDRLIDAGREPDGHVSVAKLGALITDIIKGSAPNS